MGLLNTLETILTVMEDKEEVHAQLEPIILQVTIKHRFIVDLFQCGTSDVLKRIGCIVLLMIYYVSSSCY
jgi:hypothetical protein